jgi:hypothetical protein
MQAPRSSHHANPDWVGIGGVEFAMSERAGHQRGRDLFELLAEVVGHVGVSDEDVVTPRRWPLTFSRSKRLGCRLSTGRGTGTRGSWCYVLRNQDARDSSLRHALYLRVGDIRFTRLEEDRYAVGGFADQRGDPESSRACRTPPPTRPTTGSR